MSPRARCAPCLSFIRWERPEGFALPDLAAFRSCDVGKRRRSTTGANGFVTARKQSSTATVGFAIAQDSNGAHWDSFAASQDLGRCGGVHFAGH